MKTWRTDGGMSVTAASREAADALAALYGAHIVGEAMPRPSRRAERTIWVVWDDLTQSIILASTDAAQIYDALAQPHAVLMVRTDRGGLRPPTAAERRIFLEAE